MTWVSYDKADDAIIEEIRSQKDRGAALVAAAFVDSRLIEAIKTRLKPDLGNLLEGRIFKNNGPLSSFAARIDMGYALQLYPEEVMDGLHRYRKIRNDFAHTKEPIDFNTASICARCSNLQQDLLRMMSSGMKHYSDLVVIIGYPFGEKRWNGKFSAHEEADTPREQYIMTTKLFLLLLHVVTDALSQMQFSVPPSPDKS